MSPRPGRHALLVPILGMLTACAPATTGRNDLLALPDLPEGIVTVPVRTASPTPAEASPFPPVTGELSVSRAVTLVLDRHPSAGASEARVRAAEAARRQAGAWSNPVLDLEIEGIGADEGAGEVTASLGLPLDLFGVRSAGVAEATAEMRIQQARHHAELRELTGTVRRAFLRILEARAEFRAASEALEVVLETVETVRRAEAAGKASQLELRRWEVQAGHARADLELARTRLDVARLELAGLWNGRGADPFEVSGDLRREPLSLDPDSLRRHVLEKHPGVLEAAWTVERARRHGVRLERQRWPEVVPAIGVRRDLDRREHSLVAGVGFTLPVFDRKGAARREAALLGDAARLSLLDTRLRLDAELDRLLLEIERHADRLRTYVENTLPAAEESYRLLQLGYGRGKLGYIELLDGQTSLLDARARMTRILVDYNRAIVELEILIGTEIGDEPASGTIDGSSEPGTGDTR